MKITACCCTFNRPQFLGRLIRCFELQDHEDRELIILDDAGQYGDREGDRWRIVSVDQRFPSLGDKRNETIRLAGYDTDAVAIWDDDDIYLPWALSASVAALDGVAWAQPRQVLKEIRPGLLTRVETFNHLTPDQFGYQGGWSFRQWAIKDLGGYPPISNGEDIVLASKMREQWGQSADTLSDKHPVPFYIFNFRGGRDTYHISGMGKGNTGWDRLAKRAVEPAGELVIGWPRDYRELPVGDDVHRRRW